MGVNDYLTNGFERVGRMDRISKIQTVYNAVTRDAPGTDLHKRVVENREP